MLLLAIALMHDGRVGDRQAIPAAATRSPFDTVRSRHPFAATSRILTRFWSWTRPARSSSSSCWWKDATRDQGTCTTAW